MGIYARVPSCPCQCLVLLVRDVLVRLQVAILLAQSKVNHVHDMRVVSDPHQEVLGLYVSVDVILRVDPFDTLDELVGQHQSAFQGQSLPTQREQVLHSRAE